MARCGTSLQDRWYPSAVTYAFSRQIVKFNTLANAVFVLDRYEGLEARLLVGADTPAGSGRLVSIMTGPPAEGWWRRWNR